MTGFVALPPQDAGARPIDLYDTWVTIARSAARLLATAAAAMLVVAAAPLSAQSIEPYFADTSDYETPGFRISDTYTLPAPGCYTEVEEPPAITATGIRLALRLEPQPFCAPGASSPRVVVDRLFWVGTPLPAGGYSVEFGYLLGGAWIPRVAGTLAVDDGRNKCSRMPESNSVIVQTVSNTVADRMAAVAVNPALDPALYEALVRPVASHPFFTFPWVGLGYFPLDDTQDIARRLAADGAALGVTDASPNSFVCFLGYNRSLEIFEYFNTGLGHYFITADAVEMAAIDSGGAGPGWQRTGEKITGFVADVCSSHGVPNPTPLYRFYGTAGRGPNSHFFTADRSECGQVRGDPGWTYESTPFRVWATVAGRCPTKSLPVSRLYNDRAAQNDSNHRYTSRAAIVDQMIAAGWKNEGVTFCIPQS